MAAGTSQGAEGKLSADLLVGAVSSYVGFGANIAAVGLMKSSSGGDEEYVGFGGGVELWLLG